MRYVRSCLQIVFKFSSLTESEENEDKLESLKRMQSSFHRGTLYNFLKKVREEFGEEREPYARQAKVPKERRISQPADPTQRSIASRKRAPPKDRTELGPIKKKTRTKRSSRAKHLSKNYIILLGMFV